LALGADVEIAFDLFTVDRVATTWAFDP
jgi:hypothetical protein